MLLDKLVDYFLPVEMRDNKMHLRYDEFRVLTSSAVISLPILIIFPLFLLYLGKPFAGYYLNLFLVVCMLFSIKFLAHYRIPMTLLAVVTYFILYNFIKETGQIYSAHMGLMHMYLLAAIWVDKRWGWWAIISNVLIFIYIYYQTLYTNISNNASSFLGSPLYALVLHCFITILLGVFLAYEQFDQESNRKKIRALQDQKINLLDEAVKQRTNQLNNMRQIMAADFHDETGNMLSAITRQASLLKLKLHNNNESLPIVESIIKNSNDLYARSKDFLWNHNHNSDEPLELFKYLTGYGQLFYNQFDIAFSTVVKGDIQELQQLDTFAALNLIFIFKEAMTNVVKHANAKEVVIEMAYGENKVMYTLQDDGKWKHPDNSQHHYGLKNIERRCEKNNFNFLLSMQEERTRIEITVPVNAYFT